RNPNLLFHAAGKLVRTAILVRQAKPRQQVARIIPRDAPQQKRCRQGLFRILPERERWAFLRQVRDTGPSARPQWHAVDEGLSFRCRGRASKDLEQRGLSGSVGPEEPNDLALQRDDQVLQRIPIAIAYGETLQFDLHRV